MARDTVVLSPEYNNVGRIEGVAVGSVIDTGAFVEHASGGLQVATTLLAASMLAVENVAVAQGLSYQYAIGENVFAQALPRGVLCNVKAVAAAYNPGDLLEVGAAGQLQAVTTGVPVAVVPHFGGEVISAGNSLLVQLL